MKPQIHESSAADYSEHRLASIKTARHALCGGMESVKRRHYAAQHSPCIDRVLVDMHNFESARLQVTGAKCWTSALGDVLLSQHSLLLHRISSHLLCDAASSAAVRGVRPYGSWYAADNHLRHSQCHQKFQALPTAIACRVAQNEC